MYDKPFAERVLEAIILLHNKETSKIEDEDAQVQAKFSVIEEPVVQYLLDRDLARLGGLDGKNVSLSPGGRNYYQAILSIIQQQIVR
jgi:hypothetical protein